MEWIAALEDGIFGVLYENELTYLPDLVVLGLDLSFFFVDLWRLHPPSLPRSLPGVGFVEMLSLSVLRFRSDMGHKRLSVHHLLPIFLHHPNRMTPFPSLVTSTSPLNFS